MMVQGTAKHAAPQRQHLNGRIIAGIQVRTNNRLEMSPDDSRIDRLWDGFRSEHLDRQIPDRAAGSPVYGVYSDYQDGEDGDYSVLAGVEVTDEAKIPDDYRTVVIEAGDYLVFRARGRLADIVMETWSAIWRYFEQGDTPQRRFQTDYEVYESTDKIAIYIGVR